MKAILVTKNNQDTLVSKFGVDPDDKDTLVPVDYYLVGEFGDRLPPDIVSASEFGALFTVGDKLKNGFVEITRK